MHQDQREPLQEPGLYDGALNPQMVDIIGPCVLSPLRSRVHRQAHCFLVCRVLHLVNHPDEKFVDASPPAEVTQKQSAGQSPIASDSPPLPNTASPSLHPTPQILSKMNYRSDPLPPENHGGSAGADESQNERLDASSRETLQHPPPDADDNYSESDVASPEYRDVSVRMDEGPNETPPAGPTATLQDHPSHADYDSSGSRTDLQDILGSRNASRVDMSDEGSGKLSVRKFVFVAAETSIGSDLNRDSDGDDKGASGTSSISVLTTCTLHGRRFSSEFR